MQKQAFKLKPLSVFVLAMGLISCTKNVPTPLPVADPAAALQERGKRAYMVNCTACHNTDPSKDGVIGPSLVGSTFDLIQKRLMEGTYPEGYKPKRATKTMAALPHLKDELEAIHSYLNSK